MMEPMAIEEMTAMNRKRERDDKIGKLMGDYLLKGYKMLGSSCSSCGTILLRDRMQQDYCIGCNEVDEMSQVAAASYPKAPTDEAHFVESSSSQNPSGLVGEPCEIIRKVQEEKDALNTTKRMQKSFTEYSEQHNKQSYDSAIMKLQERIAWAANQLGNGCSVEMDIKLAELICSCGSALKVLLELQE